MASITEFLEARIASEESEAETAAAEFAHGGYGCFGPARVLAECGAKRMILAMHRRTMDVYGDALGDTCTTCADSGPDAQSFPCATVKALAAVYKDHPDYQQEWAL